MQRVEIITGKERRRRWSEAEKARLVAETLELGRSSPMSPAGMGWRKAACTRGAASWSTGWLIRGRVMTLRC